MLLAPLLARLLRLLHVLPVHVQQHQVVALRVAERRLDHLRLLVLRPHERRWDGQHGGDRQHLGHAPVRRRRQQRLRQLRVQRQLRHLLAQRRQLALVAQRAQVVQVLQRAHHGLRRGWVHEVELDEVRDAEFQHRQNHGGNVASHDLGIALFLRVTITPHTHQQLRVEGLLGVQSEALARTRSTRTTRTLSRRRLADGRHKQR